jgi:dimethylargininase
MLTALIRGVSRSISECELTFIDRQVIDSACAIEQHHQYQELLKSLGVRVIDVPAEDACPDCCFLEDTAVVLDEIAIISRPGSEARRREVEGVKSFVGQYRTTVEVEAPATLEGGDVLRIGRDLFVGVTSRTNLQGVEALRTHASQHGYKIHAVTVPGALHLKSVCTAIDDHTILADPSRFDIVPFANYEIVKVPREEWMAANILRVNSTVCMHSGFPATRNLLEKRGVTVRTTDISEFLKAEAGLTCMSLLYEA